MPTDEEPLRASALPSEGDGEATPAAAPAAPAAAPAAKPRPPAPAFKLSTFVYLFLGFVGFWMLVDASARNAIAGWLGTSLSNPGFLYTLIGFQSQYLLLTMALAGAIEMLITALAYNYTTDWIKAAKVQKWSAAFRKVQMEAIRSGKKDRIEALKPHQERLTRLSSEVSIAQFKGMAITYFLLILIYTWIGLTIGAAPASAQTITIGGEYIVLTAPVFPNSALAILAWWFVIFTLYTFPASLLFRRVLKHLWLKRYMRENHPPAEDLSPSKGAGA